MAKIARNQPCPCGSRKKYKRCCLRKDEELDLRIKAQLQAPDASSFLDYDDYLLDDLTNQVPDLIREQSFDEADRVCARLRRDFPDMVDGWRRQALVHHARGLRKEAAHYYRLAAEMALKQEGFEGIQDWLDLADRLDSDEPFEPLHLRPTI